MQLGSAGYAYGQIRLCLSDLANASHGTKLKAVKRFQDYIANTKPDLNDDDVLYLFAGAGAAEMQGAASSVGLLYYAGIDSGKHGGQLKRICAPVIGLIRYLISLPPFGRDIESSEYNMFFEIFVTIPMQELSRINFVKHILGEADRGSLFGSNRSGGANDALEILSILVRDHRTPEGDPDPIDVTQLLGDNKICRDRLNQYMQKTNSEVVTRAMQQFKVAQTKAVAATWDDTRPSKWEDDNFKRVPVQEGEEGEVLENDDEIQMSILPDPLGLSELDLRATQKLYASGRLAVPTAGLGRQQGVGSVVGARRRRDSMGSVDDDDENVIDGKGIGGTSVMPQDKAFSPSLFLTLIHGGISFDQLQLGSNNLRLQLEQQNSQRENLVRIHFGLFVHCAEGLDWLKAYRKGIYTNQTETAVAARQAVSISPKDSGEQMLSRAKMALECARNEATDALKPILDRMRKMRKLKTADQVLRRLTPTLENPHKMRLALTRGDLDEVIAIYIKVQSIPPSTALRVVQGVKDSVEVIMGELTQHCCAAMSVAEPDVNILLRCAKIIGELEGDDSYRAQIKQCFASQLAHFNADIDSLMGRFAVDAFAAHCHARDLRAEAEAEARAGSAHFNRPKVMLSVAPSRIVSAAEWMPETSADDEPRFRRHDDDLAAENRVPQDDNDDDNDNNFKMASDDDSLNFIPGMRFEETCKANHVLLASKVRELHLTRLVSVVAKWLPCLHRLVQEAMSKVAVGGKDLWVTGDSERARVHVKIALNRKKGPPPVVMLGSSLIACCEAIQYTVIGLKDQSDGMASMEHLSGGGGGNMMSGRDPAFEPLILKQEKMLEIRDTNIFDDDSFALPLNEPYLSRCVHDVGDLFDVMSALYQSKGDVAALSGDARKHHELYLTAVGILRHLSRGGEVSIAVRAMKMLREQSLLLFENKKQTRDDKSKDKFSKQGPFGAQLMDPTNRADSDLSCGNVERTVLDLKALIAMHLHRLSLKTRRPEWVSEKVREGLRSIFSSLVDGMRQEALLLDDDTEDARRLVRSASRGRARTVTVSALQSPELLQLETELKRGQVSETACGEYLLDVLRACVILRTDVIPRLWREVKHSFPAVAEGDELSVPSTRGTVSLFDVTDINQRWAASDDDHPGLRKNSSGSGLTTLSVSDLFNRIMKTVGFEIPEANVNIEEVVRLEGAVLNKYVLCKLDGLRVVCMAGYMVLTKREAAGAWREVGMRPDGFVVPPHLSRLLLMLGNEKSILEATLSQMAIEYGADSDGAVGGARRERYQEYIFKVICHGILDIYAELVARVNGNRVSPDSDGLLLKTDLASVLTGSTSAQCQHPRAYGQATEELVYLLSIIRPLLQSSSLPPPFNRHNPVGAGDEFLSAEDLLKEGGIFAASVNVF